MAEELQAQSNKVQTNFLADLIQMNAGFADCELNEDDFEG